jgi:hypothetical protein
MVAIGHVVPTHVWEARACEREEEVGGAERAG